MGNYKDYTEQEAMLHLLNESAIAYQSIDENLRLIKRARSGITKAQLYRFTSEAGLTMKQLGQLLHVSERTLQRLTDDEHLPVITSDRFLQVVRVFAQAMVVFGSTQKACKWIHSGIPALGGQSPFSMLDTSFGIDKVYTELHRMMHGVYS